MKTLKLKQGLMADLLIILEAIPPKDFTDLKSMRKISSAADVLRKSCRDYNEKIEAINEELNKLLENDRAKFAALSRNAEDQEKRNLLEVEMNKKAKPIIEKSENLRKEDGDKIVKCNLDDNYFTELQNVFKTKGKDYIRTVEAILEIADGLEITD